MVRFKNFTKKNMPLSNPIAVAPPDSQVPEQTVDPIMELAEAIVWVKSSPSDVPTLGKQKGKELIEGTSRRSKRKAGETSLGAPAKLWKSEFFTCELGKQVTVVDST